MADVIIVGAGLAGLAAATSWGAAATLVTGFLVLIGAAAATLPEFEIVDRLTVREPGDAREELQAELDRLLAGAVVEFATDSAELTAKGRAVLDEVVRGSGKVIPSSQVQMVQNLEGGIVKEIRVREGEVVEAGQVLLTIDDTRFDASLQESRLRALTLEARMRRLQAEADGLRFRLEAEADAAPRWNFYKYLIDRDYQIQLITRQGRVPFGSGPTHLGRLLRCLAINRLCGNEKSRCADSSALSGSDCGNCAHS